MKSEEQRNFPRTNTTRVIASAGPRQVSLTSLYRPQESAVRRILASGPRSLRRQMEDAEVGPLRTDLSASEEFLYGLYMTPFVIQQAIIDASVTYWTGVLPKKED